MRKTFLLFSFLITCLIVLFQSTQLAYSSKLGAIPGATGSPFDGHTCYDAGPNCHHDISPIALPNLIFSNVPITGYIPGSTYTITATVSSPNLIRFGFEISPQDSLGNLLGMLTITDPARMHFTGIGQKYITHDTLGTWAPSHTNTWSFDWKAPAAGTGCVTFYGAFNYANNNKLSTGDTIHTSTLTICENTVGINDPSIISSINIYPNPAGSQLELSYYLENKQEVEINLFDERGSQVMKLFKGIQNGGAQRLSMNLDEKISSGIYFLQLKAGEQVMMKKVMKL